ncbi:MAG: AAA family ATPase [Ktedonobacteraceae bacterium]|nr:AAA family ATPase [Ktedonobacteraceae bacterium]
MSTQSSMSRSGEENTEQHAIGDQAHASTDAVEKILRNLLDELQRGRGVVDENVWSYKTKDWATSVHAADIDGDGDTEILVGSRDGYIHALTKWKTSKWETLPSDTRAWIRTVVGIERGDDSHPDQQASRVCVIAGSSNGCVYGLDQKGIVVAARDLHSGIRKVLVNPLYTTEVIVGTEDGCVYMLERESLKVRWRRDQLGGTIRSLFFYDLNSDNVGEILAASGDGHIYILDSAGNILDKIATIYKVYALYVARLNTKNEITIVAGTSNRHKPLLAWTVIPQDGQQPHFSEVQSLTPDDSPFESRIYAIHVADINQDGQLEILLGAEDGYLYILDQRCQLLWKHFVGQRVSNIYTADIDHDGIVEVLLGMEDNNVQGLHVALNSGDDLYKAIHKHYGDLMQASLDSNSIPTMERQLLRHLVKEQVPPPIYNHMEWFDAINLMHKHDYQEALPLLLRLRRQRVQHFWSSPMTGKGYIRTLAYGEYVKDDVSELLFGTEEGSIVIVDIAGKTGGRARDITFTCGIFQLESQTLDADKADAILALTSDHRVRLLDDHGNIIRELELQDEDVVLSLYIYKQGDRALDALSEIWVTLAGNRIYVYDGKLECRLDTIETRENNRLVCTYDLGLDASNARQIITATANNNVYVYRRDHTECWHYDRIRDRIRAICVTDVDRDGHAEVIVGSEDRNVYVLDDGGHLKWRYSIPHRVLAIATADVDNDGYIEILLGSQDGYLYVLSADGDLLWKYKASDRVTAIVARDLHAYDSGHDKVVEICLAAGDTLEIIQALDHKEVTKQIDKCWKNLLNYLGFDHPIETMHPYMRDDNEDIRALARAKRAGRTDLKPQKEDLDAYRKALDTEESPEARKELARLAAILDRNHCDDEQCRNLVRQMLPRLCADPQQEVKLAVIALLDRLTTTSLCFEYLDRFSLSADPCVRRAVVRKLDQLIVREAAAVLPRLLKLAQDEEEWVLQETGRSLAHYFFIHQADLFTGIQKLVDQRTEFVVMQQIASSSRGTALYNVFHVLTKLLTASTGQEDAPFEHTLREFVDVLQEPQLSGIPLHEGVKQKYQELYQLFCVHSIADIAQYTWCGDSDLLEAASHSARLSSILNGLNRVIETIKNFQKRKVVGDRLAALIDANDMLMDLYGQLPSAQEEHVAHSHSGMPPEDYTLKRILSEWKRIIYQEIRRVRGNAKLSIDLKHEDMQLEEKAVISFHITNHGRSPAEKVRLRLEESQDYYIVGCSEVEVPEIATHSPVDVNFTIQPVASSLHLLWHVVYNDAEGQDKESKWDEELHLSSSHASFTTIPNPYMAGRPLQPHESEVFFGREEDLLFLREKLVYPASRNNVLLIGQRRSGKTSLLYRFIAKIRPEDECVPILIDLQNLAEKQTCSQLLRAIALTIFSALQHEAINVAHPDTLDFDKDPTSAFDQFLDQATQTHTKTLILLIDELETLKHMLDSGNLPPSFFPYLRSLMQHRHNISFLLAGAPKLLHLTEPCWAELFNVLLSYSLSTLKPEEATDLITRPVRGALTYGNLALDKLRRLTDNQPYFIQLMCEALVRYCNYKHKSYVNSNDVDIICDEVTARPEHFYWIWDEIQQAKKARFVLSALAQERGEEDHVFTLEEIKDYFEEVGYPFERRKVVSVLTILVQEGFVKEEVYGSQYRIPIGLLRAWLGKTKPLDQHVQEKKSDSE